MDLSFHQLTVHHECCCLIKFPLCQEVISTTICIIHKLVPFSTCLFVKFAGSLNCHFVNLQFHQILVLSTWCFLNLMFHQLYVSSTLCFINFMFHQFLEISCCWWNIKLMKHQVDETSSWWNIKLMNRHVEEAVG